LPHRDFEWRKTTAMVRGPMGSPHLGIQFGSLEILVFLGDAFSHKMWKMDRDYRAKTSGEPFYLYNDELVS
jgi:hypothetical protein